jgi:hypothetical protein
LVIGSLLLWRAQAPAIPLDKDETIKFEARTYVNARVGTQTTQNGPPDTADTLLSKGTFPYSAAGHLRQNRLFIEAEINHDLTRMVKTVGLSDHLPFKVKRLAYHLTFRGEGEGLYDWGPSEYSSASEFEKAKLAKAPLLLIGRQVVKNQAFVDVPGTRHYLRQIGTDRERLFQAFVEADLGNLFWRVGRQVLSWGETDSFQLLDHINPIDNSFGGFMISLDQRRVPLDMALANYYIGGFGPISEMYLEGYVAIDNKVGFDPGTPAGSAWTLPSLGAPDNNTRTFKMVPARNIGDARGGFRLNFNAFDATFSLAHYYTYFDTPALQIVTNPGVGRIPGLFFAFNDGLPCPPQANPGVIQGNVCGAPTRALQTAPKVQVTGAATTFAVPRFYSVVRSEVAYFKDEPAFTQAQLDPFIFNPLNGKADNPNASTTGGRVVRDSINAVLGVDSNVWARFINSNQTILVSTQFFYKHINGAAPGGPAFLPNGKINPDREVLPINTGAYAPKFGSAEYKGLGPVFVTQPADTFLHTLFVGTSYRSGTVNPGVTFFYDWGGAILYQPALTLSHDPFRFTVNYTIIDAHTYKGGSGVSLLKDRDNVEFRFEYVI